LITCFNKGASVSGQGTALGTPWNCALWIACSQRKSRCFLCYWPLGK
jgi:hypothetical protein